MPVNFSPSEEVRRAVRWLVANEFPTLAKPGVDIDCQFRDDLPKSGGRDVPYTVTKVPSRIAGLVRRGLGASATPTVIAPQTGEGATCRDCGGPLTQAIAGPETEYAGEVVEFCERQGCTRWLEHILVSKWRVDRSGVADAATEDDGEDASLEDETLRRVYGEESCLRTCEECEGKHHLIDEYLDLDDEEAVAEFYSQRPDFQLTEEQATGFYICKHCSAVFVPDYGDEEGVEREVSDSETFGSGSRIYPAPPTQPDLSAPFFLIEVSLPAWNDLDEVGKMGMIHEALCQCHAGRSEKSGAVTLQKRKGITLFPENLRRFGLWSDDAQEIFNALEARPDQVSLPFEEIGSLDARMSAKQASEILSGPRPVLEIAGMGMIEPGDVQADGELRQVLVATEPGTAEDVQDHEAMRTLEDVTEELLEETVAPVLSVVDGGSAPRSRKKDPAEVVQPNPEGWDQHKAERREANLAGAAGA